MEPRLYTSSVQLQGEQNGTQRVKWRHISVVAMRSPFCRSTRRTVCS